MTGSEVRRDALVVIHRMFHSWQLQANSAARKRDDNILETAAAVARYK